jgi:hypothetical protein
MVERHPYTVDTGVQFSNEVPNLSVTRFDPVTRYQQYATVAERSNASDCKSLNPGVQIPPVAPVNTRYSEMISPVLWEHEAEV